MHGLDRLCGLRCLGEPNKRETTRSTGVPIGGDVHVYNLTYLGQQIAKLLVRHTEVEIAYEYLV
jgi:hypothetical protein